MNLRQCTALLLVIPLSAFAQPAPANVAPQPQTLDGAAAHVYKTIAGHELRLHVFEPASADASKPRPAIVFFFGGGWTQGTVNQFVPQAKALVERGMVAIIADYRVRARHQTTPFDAIADGKSAIRWVRANAAKLRIDSTRIAAAGGSSGGHLALSTAVFDRFDEAREDPSISSKPNALVLFNPAVDTSLVKQFGDRTEEGSPFHHLRTGLPPTLIVHGKADTTVPYETVERYCAKAVSLGNRCGLIGYDGAVHGFFNPQNAAGKWYAETLREAEKFLAELGYIQGSR
jgi:acetyl esterase